jgi:tetratricopeptide (TPR) repeat protein
MVGDYRAALAAYSAASDGFVRAGEKTLAGATQRQMGRVYWELGKRARAIVHHQRALAMLEVHPKQRGTWRQRLERYQQTLATLETSPESVEVARTISMLSQMHMLAGELEAAIVHGECALVMARRLEAADVVRHALLNVGTVQNHLGRPDLGLPLLQESLDLALRAGSAHDACRAYTNTVEALSLILCRYEAARALVQEMLAYATNAQAMLFIGTALYDLALIDWLTGRWPEALATCERMRAWMGSHEASASKVWASMLLGRIENDLGRPEQAWTILEEQLSRARSLDDLQSTVPHLAQLARAYQAGGREAEAQALMREYLAQVERTTAYDPTANATLLFACQWHAAQRTPAGLDIARKCLGRLEETNAGHQRPATSAAWHEALGSVALASGEAALAAERLAQAAEHWAAIGHPYDQMRALAQLSQARQHAGDAAGAAATREASLALVGQLAAQLPNDERRGAFVRTATSWIDTDG